MPDLARNSHIPPIPTALGLAALLAVASHRMTHRALSPRGRSSVCRSGSHPAAGPGGGGANLPHRPAGFFDLSDLMEGARHVSCRFDPPVIHDGTGCPLPAGTVVRVTLEYQPDTFHTVITTVGHAAGPAWFWENYLTAFDDGTLCGRVVAYAVKRPDALAQLRAIAAEPLAPRRAPVPA